MEASSTHTEQETTDQSAQTTRKARHTQSPKPNPCNRPIGAERPGGLLVYIFTHKEDDAQIYMTLDHIEEGTVARLVFVHKYLHQDAGASTEEDNDGIGTDRRCTGVGRKVGVGARAGTGGTALPQLEERRASESLGAPASAAPAAFVVHPAVSVAVLPSGNIEIEVFRRVYRMPGTVVRVQLRVQLRVQIWAGDIPEREPDRAQAHTPNRESWSTPSIQAELAAGTESECHHSVQHRSDCVCRPFQDDNFAPGVAGWAEEAL